jgi:hypothetical protein
MRVDFSEGALPYAEKLGWKVILLQRGWKLPFLSKEKGGNGVHDASSDPEQIRKWSRMNPSGNVGIACGDASGVFVVDVDPRNDGDKSIRALAARGYQFPPGPRQRSGNGGWHLLFQHEAGITNSKGRLGPGVDVKSTGGYILAAPSWTRKSADGPGGSYHWEISPFETSVPKMPVWMKAMLCPAPRPLPEFRSSGPQDIRSLIDFVASASDGNRNNSLYWAACRIVEIGNLTPSAQAALLHAAVAAGLERQKALATINSAARKNR